MINTDIYVGLLEESSKIRKEISEVHRARMLDLKRIFVEVTSEKDNTFSLIKDMIYYQGGYPMENSPPKIEVLMRDAARTTAWLSYLGYEKLLEREFSKYGMKITFDSSILPFECSMNAQLSEKLRFVFFKLFGFEAPTNVRELLIYVIEESLIVQGEICKKSDSIKRDNASIAKSLCDVEKSVFVENVFLDYANQKTRGEIDKQLVKARKLSSDSADMVSLMKDRQSQFSHPE